MSSLHPGLLPGSSILSILLLTYSLPFLCTSPNHLSLALLDLAVFLQLKSLSTLLTLSVLYSLDVLSIV